MKNTLLAPTIAAFLLASGLALGAPPEADSNVEEKSATSKRGEEVLVTLQVPLGSPLFAQTPVAVVDGEPITLHDLERRIFSIHVGMEEESTTTRKDYADLLGRVITMQLIVQESYNIGLDELPEVASRIDSFSTDLLVSTLMSRELAKVEADPTEVDELYKKMSRELLMVTVKFENEEDASSFEERLESGENFDGLVKDFEAEGSAEAGSSDYMKLKDLLPKVAQAVYDMEVGSVSQIFSAPDGFFLFHLEEERFYDDPEAQEQARKMVLQPLKKEATREYVDRLLAKHCTVDERLLRRVDFETERSGFLSFGEKKKVDFAKLQTDQRVVARVHTDPPFTVTIGDLASQLKEAFYHGIETAMEKRDLNEEKRVVLRNLLFERTAVAEARELGLDQTDEYRDTLDEFTNSVLFDTFVDKAVAPDVEIQEEEVRQYYQEHIDDFSTPKMLRLHDLAFHEKADAEAALGKIRRGADFKWVSANSHGQVDRGTEGASKFEGAPLTVTALPGEIQKSAAGARRGDAMLYSDPGGYHYTVVVDEVYPATPRSYEAVRQPIAKIIAERKTRALIDDWVEKLKEVYETRIFATGFDD
jgi:hypothetical protein